MLRTIWLLEFEWSSTPLYFNDTSYCNGFLYFHTLPFYIYIYGVILANFQRNVLNAGVSCISLQEGVHQESLYLLVWPKRSVITTAWGLIGRNNIVSSQRI